VIGIALVPAAAWSIHRDAVRLEAGHLEANSGWLVALVAASISATGVVAASLAMWMFGEHRIHSVLVGMFIRTGLPLAAIAVYVASFGRDADMGFVMLVAYFYVVAIAAHTVVAVRDFHTQSQTSA